MACYFIPLGVNLPPVGLLLFLTGKTYAGYLNAAAVTQPAFAIRRRFFCFCSAPGKTSPQEGIKK